jgi:hypothetical protein
MPLLRTGFISLKFRYYDDRAFHVNEKGAHKKKHLVLVILSLGGRNSWAIQESVTCGTVFLRSDRVREVKQSVDDLTKPSFSS